ncbi:MAG: LamG-like jellyroll fold domain-containing protein [Candidatus Acidiferrales bacterium]
MRPSFVSGVSSPISGARRKGAQKGVRETENDTTFRGFQGQSRVLYWDGQPVTIDQGPNGQNKTSQLTTGASTVFGGLFFDGSIDEVVLWNRSLSAAEVAAIYKYTRK